jgi:tripartite-type tricarboxylate transporter receptor subunit TctC
MAVLRSGVRLLVPLIVFCQPVADGSAQSYPSRSIRIVVGTSAGGGGDVIARVVAGGLTPILGQQVSVDDRPGAASNIAAEIVAKAPPDGYTLFEVSITHAVNVSLYRNLPFDLMRDFAAVTQLANSPQILVVHPSLPVRSTDELVRLAKSRPGAVNYSSAGAGTSTFLAAELFMARAGVNLVHVPYRGGGAALTAVIAGETPVYFAPVASSLPQIRAGRLRALALTSAERMSLLPGLPTVAEAGYPGYECGNWYGLMVPVETPKATQAALHRAVLAALIQPDVNQRLVDLGYIVVGDQPEEFAAYIRSEVEKLAKIVKALNLKADASD